MKIAAEMDVSVNPTLTFFNTQHEDEGLKDLYFQQSPKARFHP